MLSLVAMIAAIPLQLYVDDQGNDANSGRSSTKAIQSLGRLAEVLKTTSQRPVIVRIRGKIRTPKTAVFGTEFTDVTLEGGTGSSIIGGLQLEKPIVDQFEGHPCLSVKVPEGLHPKQFFCDGVGYRRPTLPRKGFYHFASFLNGEEKSEWNKGQTTMKFGAHDLKAWRNLDEVEIVAHHFWVTSILPIRSVDEQTNTVEFGKRSVFKLADDYTGGAAPYTVENVAEAFGEPRDWYFDSQKSRLYYIPVAFDAKGNETATDLKKALRLRTEIPTASTILRVENAKGFSIKGIDFRLTEWSYPTDTSGDGQAAISVPGALQFLNCENGRVASCGISDVGTYGIEFLSGCNHNLVERVQMDNLGAGGVKIGHDTDSTTVRNCRIEGGGRIYASAIGIWIGNSGNNVVSHNTIRDFFYTGISVGWSWGYGPSKATHNQILDNHIAQIGQDQLSDMGGIYTLGVSPGTIIRGNLIEDISARGYGGWGIYTDEGSSGILIEKNVVLNTKTGGFHQHYGKENTVRNNVFCYAKRDGQIIRTREEDHSSFSFERNIVIWKGTELLGGAWGNGHYIFGHNLLCREDGGKVTLPPKDMESIVVPKLSLDRGWMPSAQDAARIGFERFNILQAGSSRVTR